MTAIVILNVIGATLIVTAIVSLLAWAVRSERRNELALAPVRRRSARPATRTARRPQSARAVPGL
jgi:hypothetical protein